MDRTTFLICMSYLTLTYFLGHVLFLARASYTYPTLVASTIGSAGDLVSELIRRNGKDGSQFPYIDSSDQLQNLRGAGNRHLTEKNSAEDGVPSSPPTMQDPYPPTFSAIVTGNTLSEGFQVDNFEDESDRAHSETVRTSSTVVDSLPAFVIGFASSIVLCAGYVVFSETRDRCKNQGSNANESNTVTTGNKCHRHYMMSRDCQSIIAASVASRPRSLLLIPADHDHASSTNSVHYYEKGPDGLVYPVILVSNVSHRRAIVRKNAQDNPDHQLYDERSLSPVSTITSSVALESTNSNRGITELTELHRVSRDTKLQSLVDLAKVSASPSSSRSQSIFSLPKTKCSDAQEIFKKGYQEQEEISRSLEKDLQAISVCHFDGILAEPSSIMADTCMDDTHSISEEDESGWTSCGGKSDSSSEVSIGTYLKSICSARSRSSARTMTTNKSSVLFGESLATSPKKISHKETREDENSMELSLEDDSFSLTETRTESDHDVTILLNDILNTGSSSSSLSANVRGEQMQDMIVKVNSIDMDLSKEAEVIAGSELVSSAECTDIVTSISRKGLADNNESKGDIQGASTEIGVSSSQLAQFLERNKIVLSGYPKDKSVLSTTGSRSSSCALSFNLFVDRREDSAESDLVVGDNRAPDPASDPAVSALEDGSPAADQIFVGDIILAVNDAQTTCWNTSDDALSMGEVEMASEHWRSRNFIELNFMGTENGSTSTQDSILECNISTSLRVGAGDDVDV